MQPVTKSTPSTLSQPDPAAAQPQTPVGIGSQTKSTMTSASSEKKPESDFSYFRPWTWFGRSNKKEAPKQQPSQPPEQASASANSNNAAPVTAKNEEPAPQPATAKTETLAAAKSDEKKPEAKPAEIKPGMWVQIKGFFAFVAYPVLKATGRTPVYENGDLILVKNETKVPETTDKK